MFASLFLFIIIIISRRIIVRIIIIISIVIVIILIINIGFDFNAKLAIFRLGPPAEKISVFVFIPSLSFA